MDTGLVKVCIKLPDVDGVTVMVPVTGALVAFNPVKEAILPDPLAAKPMDVVVFVQLNVVPATVPLKITAAVAVLLQIV